MVLTEEKKKLSKQSQEDQLVKLANYATPDIIDRVLSFKSLHHFICQGWKIVDSSDFQDGWHIQVICEYLEAVFSGQVRKLIINMPPRHMKSLACSVFFPAWVWLHSPGMRFLSSSYAHSLSIRDSVKCRRLIQSALYKRLMKYYHPEFLLTGDVNNKIRFENNFGGVRLASSVEGALTGEGGDCIPYDTLIATENGFIPIGKIVSEQIDVKVLSWDGEKVVLASIEKWQARRGEELVEIELENGKKIKCTLRHPVWTKNRGYVLAGELTESDECMVIE